MKKIKEDKGHPKYMSDDRNAYANVPTGAHYVSFKVPQEYGVSIPFARRNYEGNINLIEEGKE